MLCPFVCMCCKHISLLYYLLKLDYTYDKFICVEHSMDFKLGCFDCKSSLSITERFIAVTYVCTCLQLHECAYVTVWWYAGAGLVPRICLDPLP